MVTSGVIADVPWRFRIRGTVQPAQWRRGKRPEWAVSRIRGDDRNSQGRTNRRDGDVLPRQENACRLRWCRTTGDDAVQHDDADNRAGHAVAAFGAAGNLEKASGLVARTRTPRFQPNFSALLARSERCAFAASMLAWVSVIPRVSFFSASRVVTVVTTEPSDFNVASNAKV